MKTNFTREDYKEALIILDGFEEIVNNERLIHDAYAEKGYGERAQNLRANGAICGGNQMCAVGSIVWSDYVLNRAIPKPNPVIVTAECRPGSRNWYGGLKLAYDTLNNKSRKYAKKEGISLEDVVDYEGELETLFEYGLVNREMNETSKIILRIIKKSRKKLVKDLANCTD